MEAKVNLPTCPIMVGEVIPHYQAAYQYVLRERSPGNKKQSVAIDVGAHIGLWTACMSKDFDHVIAIEPDPMNYARIWKAFEPGEGGNVQTYNLALGEREGRTNLIRGDQNDGQTRISTFDEDGDVGVTMLDKLPLPENSRVELIKIDVEGYELFVLHGARATIDAHRPVIIVEENACCRKYAVTPFEADRWLKARGYYMVERKRKNYIYTHKEGA